jgi:uncharacterized membrane protein YdfJ with MMPL/SSD domain
VPFVRLPFVRLPVVRLPVVRLPVVSVPVVAAWALRHRRTVVAAWGLLFVVGAGFALGLPGRIVPGGETPANSQSNRVAEALAGSRVPTLFATVQTARPEDLATAQAAVARTIRHTDGVAGVTVAPAGTPTPGTATAAPGTATVGVVQISTYGGVDGSIKVAHVLDRRRAHLGPPGVRVDVGGYGAYRDQLTALSQSDLESAEKVGLPILFVVLFLTFGSVLGAVLPMVVALSSLVIGLGVVGALALWLPMSDFVTNASSMIGVALGVDYTMFLLQRFRHAARDGADTGSAIGVAMATTGRAVLWSGLTVVLAESTLLLVDSRSVRSAALGMVVVSAVAVLSSLVVVPVAFATLGDRLLGQRQVLATLRRLRSTPQATGSWRRWGTWVTKRAPLLLGGATIVLLALAVPTLHLRSSVNISAASTLPASSSVRQAYASVEAHDGPDAQSPVVAVVDRAAVRGLEQAVSADPRVVSATPLPLPDGRVALAITARQGPYDASTRALVTALRHRGALVGGETAMSMDATAAMFGGLGRVLPVLAAVIGVLLLFALRSFLLPIKAVVLVALSLAASLGGLLALTGSTVGSWLIGAGSPEALHPIVPVTVVAIIVALSTDYEVMLISRMAETWEATGDNRASIIDGLAHTGGVITSAAAVMIAVFVGFAIAQLQPLKQLGVGLALAVFLDATVVRAVLVPAAMTVMGRWNWWSPGRRQLPTRWRPGDPGGAGRGPRAGSAEDGLVAPQAAHAVPVGQD